MKHPVFISVAATVFAAGSHAWASGVVSIGLTTQVQNYAALPVQGPVSGVGTSFVGFTGHTPIALGNFAGNGVLELAYMHNNDTAVNFANEATGAFVSLVQVGTSLPPISDVTTIAAGDVNHDGRSDLIVGGTNVRVYDVPTQTLLATYSPFSGGTIDSVASGDLNHDGFDDIVVANSNGTTITVTAISGKTGGTLATFQPFGPSYVGHSSVAVGDVNGDGTMDIAVGAETSSSPTEIKIFDSSTLATLDDFSPFASAGTSDTAPQVALADLNGDGHADIVTSVFSDSGGVKIYDGATLNLLSTIPTGAASTEILSVAAISTPEPTALSLLAIGSLATLNRRRK